MIIIFLMPQAFTKPLHISHSSWASRRQQLSPLRARSQGTGPPCAGTLSGLPTCCRIVYRRSLRSVDNNLLKGLCKAKRTEQASDLLLHRTPDLGCAPDAYSLSILLKSFCDNKKSQKALELLQMMAGVGGGCSPDVVAYNMVIHGFFIRRSK
ncbi:hypothetical protein PR202_ga00754 [Eleusine coracana subsp. coracana]|uniref:Pentatricopeptide repeat-containing protein n=1 Tax=Eleusine coracana subsp. coracana TaxID=191504 RepID=A0AAV5BFN4_ELECO|nr:hypothetical protein PR202_ga00754 [Eleusine coracana subsp. coracana]